MCINCLLDTIARGLLLGLKGGECKGAIMRAPRAVLSHAGRGCGLKGACGGWCAGVGVRCSVAGRLV